MPRELAREFFDNFIKILKSKGLNIFTGVFGAYMDIKLELDGPVNILLEA